MHKTDSSDDEDMDDASNAAPPPNEHRSSSCSMSIEEGRPHWLTPAGAVPMAGDSSGSDEPFEMSLLPEQTTNTLPPAGV